MRIEGGLLILRMREQTHSAENYIRGFRAAVWIGWLPGRPSRGILLLVRNRLYQRWFATLGMLAMLGMIVSMPLTATYALAMAGAQPTSSHHMTMADAKGEMPCHKPMKSCPDCPQKACPEMGSCLVKCFQSLAAPVSEARRSRDVILGRVAPSLGAVTAGSLIPPLLRPPSV